MTMFKSALQFLDGFPNKLTTLLRKTAMQWPIFGPLLTAFTPGYIDLDPASTCNALKDDLSLSNTIILNATYFAEATTVPTLGSCWWQPTSDISIPLCRVQFVVNTSAISAITAEAWLPTGWNGRFLAIGNGGLRGCIDYANMEYGVSLNFAVVGSDNGHDGDSGIYFQNNTEVLADFTNRSIHTEAVVGKQLVKHYYGSPHRNSYYLGCSTGGRQAAYAALHYPEDFDGIVAGAPAVDWNNYLGWKAMIARWLGAPNANTSETFIQEELWSVISEEILEQCDDLDGVKDGIITDPDACDFRPEALLCAGKKTTKCLTKPQIKALRKIYAPFYGRDGELLYPRYDPGAEAAPEAVWLMFSGAVYRSTEEWIKYVIYNDSNYDFSNFTLDDVYYVNSVDPGGISTFSGDFSAFRNRGGKFLTYHGRRDELIPAGNSKRFYNLISRTLGMPSLDSFYRLFLIPGLNHCLWGKGAVNIGQHGLASPWRTTPTHNVLLAVVDWVEKGVAPETITGISEDGIEERVHCRYPRKSVWDGSVFRCMA